MPTSTQAEIEFTRNKAVVTDLLIFGSKVFRSKIVLRTDSLLKDHTPYLDLVRVFWLFITMFLVAVQLLVSGRMYLVKIEVEKRTQELQNEIRDRIRIESQLRVVQASLQDAEEQAQLGSWERDVESGSVWWSTQIANILGRVPTREPGNVDPLIELVHPEDQSRVEVAMKRLLESGVSETLEVRTHPAHGSVQYLNATLRLIRNADGKAVRTAGTVQNITQRKLLEDELRQARDDLELRVQKRTQELALTNVALRSEMQERERIEAQFRQAQKMEILGQLAGGIAHDFNNFLTIICGYSEMLQNGSHLSDTDREWAEEIRHTGQRATLLTRQLLAFSRNQMIDPTIIDLNQIVRESEKLSLRLVGENIQIKLTLQSTPLYILGDCSQIEQILLNLAVNSRDAMPAGGVITIETKSVTIHDLTSVPVQLPGAGTYVVLSVTDTGCGMTPEVQQRIFEPFFSTKAPGKGTGLGLATVFGIVKQNHGGIHVVSAPGEGTKIDIYLPQSSEESAQVTQLSSKLMQTGHETILIAEDEQGVSDLARQILEMCGYQVLEAFDGQRALELARLHSGPIDLLISDIVMPNMGGRELMDHIRTDRPNIKVLFFSGYAADTALRDDILAEEIPFINKPFTMIQLAQKVRLVLDS